MHFENGQKILVHKLNVIRNRIRIKLNILDSIPVCIRRPVGALVLIIGVILFFIPVTNWTIVMILWARMLTKNFFYKVWNWVLPEKRYPSSREALYDLLK